jgi:hypothetical protein
VHAGRADELGDVGPVVDDQRAPAAAARACAAARARPTPRRQILGAQLQRAPPARTASTSNSESAIG